MSTDKNKPQFSLEISAHPFESSLHSTIFQKAAESLRLEFRRFEGSGNINLYFIKKRLLHSSQSSSWRIIRDYLSGKQQRSVCLLWHRMLCLLQKWSLSRISQPILTSTANRDTHITQLAFLLRLEMILSHHQQTSFAHGSSLNTTASFQKILQITLPVAQAGCSAHKLC